MNGTYPLFILLISHATTSAEFRLPCHVMVRHDTSSLLPAKECWSDQSFIR